MSNKRPVLGQFINLYNDEFYNHSGEINELLPSLLKEIRPDELITIGKNRDTLLHILAQYDDSNYALLFENNTLNYNVLDRKGRTPLHWTCRSKNEHATELLLEHGADPNITDCVGETALVYLLSGGIYSNRLRIAKLLLEYGASVDIGTSVFPSALLYLVSKPSIRFYEEPDLDKEVLLLRLLVNNTRNVNLVNKYRENALHMACFQHNMAFVNVLLESGCKHDQVDKYGELPIDKMREKQKKTQFMEMIESMTLR